MKFTKFITLFAAFAFVVTASFSVAAPVSADCSYNGWLHSGGTCANSFKNYDDDDDDDRYYRYNYNYRYQTPYSGFNYSDQSLLMMIERLQALIRLLQGQLDDADVSDVSVVTRTATDIQDDSATLRGRLYLNNENEADVWFEYGESRSNLNEDTSHQTLDDNDDMTFDEDIDGLDDNTVYYYRAVAEDENGDETRGSIVSFRTDQTSDNLDLPDLDTREAENVDTHEAELHGRVDMNDFNNGRVFFVYGENESQVEDVADDYDTYTDIDEDGDNLQKVSVDSDLDGTGTYQENVSGLDEDTDIYFSICVQFENEDNDDQILCGDVENFQTDN